MGTDHNRHILVVDDDPQVLKLFVLILTRAEYLVAAANSGQVALQILDQQLVDLVILDLSMPQPDGFEILKAVRIQRPDIKILVISGYVTGDLLKASELFGATASLSKIDAPKQLLKAVNGLLGPTGFLNRYRASNHDG
jgi:CheY-like chemotaxis protein